ncbi:hypothetical protein HMPREF9078_01028 [Capnocytophaga sp. oral taxon 380 str. F0488]|nr:hypothetical protein HMPREF9078_01028 [Capnocytophaga sp. oral taxon 380 str. F0488]
MSLFRRIPSAYGLRPKASHFSHFLILSFSHFYIFFIFAKKICF